MMLRDRSALLWMTLLTLAVFGVMALATLVLSPEPAEAAKAQDSSTPVATADTLRLSIDDAVSYAIANGLNMKLANARIESANGLVTEAMSNALPQVNIEGYYQRTFDSIYQDAGADSGLGGLFANSPFGSVNQWSGSVTATQLLWSGGRVGAGLAAAQAVRRSTAADKAQTGDDVALDVRRAYLDVQAASSVTDIARAALDVARDQLRQVELFQREGIRAEYDLIRAQVDAQNQEPPLVQARNAYVITLLDLKQKLNLPLDQPVALVTPLVSADSTLLVLDESDFDGAQRAVLDRAEADVEARKQLLRVESSNRWPTLSAEGSLSHQAFPSEVMPDANQFRRNTTGTVRLDYPIFQGGRTFGAVKRASAELEQARIELDRQRLAVGVELARGRQEVRRTLAVLYARRGTARLARRGYELAVTRYNNGLSTQLEVTDARVQTQNSAANEVIAIKDYRASLFELEHAVGRPLRTVSRTYSEIARDLETEGR